MGFIPAFKYARLKVDFRPGVDQFRLKYFLIYPSHYPHPIYIHQYRDGIQTADGCEFSAMGLQAENNMEVSRNLSFFYDIGNNCGPLSNLCHVVYATKGYIPA